MAGPAFWDGLEMGGKFRIATRSEYVILTVKRAIL